MSAFKTLTRSRGDDAIEWIVFRVPGHRVNVLTQQVMAELATALDAIDCEADANTPPSAVVLTAERDCGFFAGADLDRLDDLLRNAASDTGAIHEATSAGKAVLRRLSSRPWPTIAIIEGVCLGGGLELALACDLRIAIESPQTSLGAPEVKLGLIPGWGGTVRLPRLIGPGPAVEFAASGESVSADRAFRMGLVDACVAAGLGGDAVAALLASARANDLVAARRARLREPVTLDPAERAFIEAISTALIVGRTGGQMPAPMAVLQTMLAGSACSAADAETLEAGAFAELACGPQPRALLHVFRITSRSKHETGLEAPSASIAVDAPDRTTVADHQVGHAGIVGAGIMGSGIATRHLRSGIPVTIVDASAETLSRQMPRILEEAAWNRHRRQSDPETAVSLAALLRCDTSLSALASADLVIESVVERLSTKQEVLHELESIVGPQTILATNTSTNPIGRLAEPLKDPSRFCGIHFFNPVRQMKLVEIVRGPQSSDRTIRIAVAHGKRIGRIPIVVRDSPGFLVNRMLMTYLHEATELLREGVSMRQIDAAARHFGMPLGPIELYDMIGLDTAFFAGLVLYEAYGNRLAATPVLSVMVKSGRLGCKSGRGFYAYAANGQRIGPNPDAEKTIATYAEEPLSGRPLSDLDAIAHRLILPMLLEATRALDEGLVRDPADIDLGVIYGLGFPAFRGGLLAWADSLGPAEVLRRLEPLAPLGVRMQPTPRLETMAREEGRFHPQPPAVPVLC